MKSITTICAVASLLLARAAMAADRGGNPSVEPGSGMGTLQLELRAQTRDVLKSSVRADQARQQALAAQQARDEARANLRARRLRRLRVNRRRNVVSVWLALGNSSKIWPVWNGN